MQKRKSFRTYSGIRLPRYDRQLIKKLLFFGFVISLSLVAAGFRISNNNPKDIVDKYEENFQVGSQVELYKATTVDRNGNVDEAEMLVLYSYKRDAVYGLFRILKSVKNQGYNFLSIQRRDELPKLYVYNPDRSAVRDVSKMGFDDSLADTPWYFEDILDDDKEEWFYRDLGIETVRGVDCNVIEGRFAREEVQRQSAYRKRRYYFARDNSRAMKVDYYDRRGMFLKTLEVSDHEHLAGDASQQLRARRLQVSHYQSGKTLIMTRVKSAYDKPLRDEWFTPEGIANWTDQRDEEVLGMME